MINISHFDSDGILSLFQEGDKIFGEVETKEKRESLWRVELDLLDRIRKDQRNDIREIYSKNSRIPKSYQKVSKVFKSFPISNISKLMDRELGKFGEKKVFDPFSLGIDFSVENFDKICFHFSCASPMKRVSIKGAVTFYHWFNLYIFLDKTIFRSELDWEVQILENDQSSKKSGSKGKIVQIVEAKFTSGLHFPSYLDELEKDKCVLVQDLFSAENYPKEKIFLGITKEKLEEVIQTNILIGENYDFTGVAHCQNWCVQENGRLGFQGTQFSCQFVNDFFDSGVAMRVFGKFLKNYTVTKMDSDDEESASEEDVKEEDVKEEENDEDWVVV